jgi:hypothetical protein
MTLAPADSALIVQSLDRIPIRPVVWLWPGRLGRGKLAMFDGDPGLGKSLVTLDLCARISMGRPFPDGSSAHPASNVLLFHGEDTAEDIVNPRLDALGADRSRVFHVHRRHSLGPEPLCFPAHLHLLDRALQEVQPLLVVMDPMMAFLDRSIATGNDPSVRRVLTPLALLAERHQCAVVLIRHLNKSAGKRSLYRGAGSMAFLAACRSAWLFARHPGKPGHAVMAQLKNNLAPQQRSLSYEVVPRPNGAAELRWNGPCELTAADLLRWADRAYPARFRAREFLLTFLQEGPQPCQRIWEEALKLGLSRTTLDRARVEAEIRTYRTIHAGRSIYYWLLKDHAPPLSSDRDVRAFEEQLEVIRAKLPPQNPLEQPE